MWVCHPTLIVCQFSLARLWPHLNIIIFLFPHYCSLISLALRPSLPLLARKAIHLSFLRLGGHRLLFAPHRSAFPLCCLGGWNCRVSGRYFLSGSVLLSLTTFLSTPTLPSGPHHTFLHLRGPTTLFAPIFQEDRLRLSTTLKLPVKSYLQFQHSFLKIT